MEDGGVLLAGENIALPADRGGRLQAHLYMYKKRGLVSVWSQVYSRPVPTGHMYNEATGREVLGKR